MKFDGYDIIMNHRKTATKLGVTPYELDSLRSNVIIGTLNGRITPESVYKKIADNLDMCGEWTYVDLLDNQIITLEEAMWLEDA